MEDLSLSSRFLPSLSGLYMEVGDIRILFENYFLCVIELWTGSCSDTKCTRAESQRILRLPLQVIKEKIVDLSAGRKVILLLQSDETACPISDPIGWGSAVSPLLQHLASQLSDCLLYTYRTYDEIIEFYNNFHERRKKFASLFEHVGIVITCQANRYVDPANRMVTDGKTILESLKTE